jgi:hypothetical protein
VLATDVVGVNVDDTIPQNTEGSEFYTVSITPTASANLLIIECHIVGSNSSNAGNIVALFQDSTADALAASLETHQTNFRFSMNLVHYMTAGTTSSTTFKVRAGAGAGTMTINGGGGVAYMGGSFYSGIRVTEIEV